MKGVKAGISETNQLLPNHTIVEDNKTQANIMMVITIPTKTLTMQKIESSNAEPHELHKSRLEFKRISNECNVAEQTVRN